MKLVATAFLVVLLAACSGSEPAETAEAIAPAEPTPIPTTLPVQSATPASPDQSVAEVEVASDTVTLWFPQHPASTEDRSKVFAYERTSMLSDSASESERLYEVLEMWLEGPARRDDGFLHPLGYFAETCSANFRIENEGGSITVTPCGDYWAGGPESGEMAIASLAATLGEVGFSEVALLVPFGDECIGNQTDDDPLACVPGALRVPVEEGVRCPLRRPRATATISGVADWVNTRSGPSTDAFLIGRLDADSTVQAIRSTLTLDETGRWWVLVENPTSERCFWIAAEFLADEQGVPLGPIMPGVTFALPVTGHWTFRSPAEGTSEAWGGIWRLDEGPKTQISITLESGDVAEGARTVTAVPGSDAGFDVTTPSDSGDGAEQELWYRVGDHTVAVRTYLYIEDLDVASWVEIEAFAASVEINPEVFLANVPE